MLGFKSFAVRTVLEFSTGITAVVGPNGAGKSNVADAVRWVLGEQSMRQLRGKKSDDIIFSGGHGKSALGMAEVSLTLDNSTGWVPSEYSEITVTRRSYRSGENEYLINKQKVRLRDVILLLAQARIGHDSYTVVGQGLVDAALSLRAEERRGLFEDAAGIRPYQVQRAEAENRLRQTEQNLERLRDIVSEIEPRLEPLAEQARRAIESRQLNSELQEVLLTWYALQWRRLRTTRERTEVAEQEQAQKEYEMDERRLRNAQSELIQVQARLGASQSDLGRQQKHLGERNRTLAARRESIAQIKQSTRVLETRLVEERAQLEAAREEEQQITQRKQGIARAIADAQREIERLKAALAEAERLRRTVSDRLNMLRNWRSSLGGYSDGVRALLRAPAGKLTGIIGPVPQPGVAPAGLETALETALGPYVQAVVVQTLDDARACLDYLRATKGGKAMVVWMDGGIEDAQPQKEEAALNRLLADLPALRDHVRGMAWRFMQCEQRYQPLFRRVLRGTVIVDELETARKLLDFLLRSHSVPADSYYIEKLVTRGGEVLHIDGWLTGGSAKDGGQQGLLTYERELRELPQPLEEHLALIDRLNADISEVQRSQEARRIEQNAVDKELQKNAARINDLSRKTGETQREQERLQTELQLANSVEQQLAAELAGLEQEVQAALERVRAHEKSQREMTGLVEELQREVEERTIAYRRQQDDLGRARTALAVKRQEAKSLRQQLQAQQAQVQDLKLQVEQHITRIKEAGERHQALQGFFETRRSELEQAQRHTQVLTDALRVAEEEAGELDQQVIAVEQEILQVRHTMAELEVTYRHCLLESQKARDAVDALLEQLHEEMGITDPRELVGYAANGYKVAEAPDDSDTAEAETEILSQAQTAP